MVWLGFIKDITQEFWGDLGFAALFAIALIAILVLEHDKIRRTAFLWYTCLALVFIYNPLTYYLCRKLLEESTFQQYYQRFYSVIPILAIIAYGLTLILSHFSGYKKLIGTLAAMAVIALLGNCLYTEDWFTKAENRNKVPQDVVTICDIFADETDTIRIMAPLDIAVYLRQMESKFSMPYARSLPDEAYELTNERPDVQSVVDYAKENNVDYVVVSAVDNVIGAYQNYGFELVGRTSYYGVLKVEDPVWIVTEYEDASGDQGLCYTIYNQNDGTLILVDGGTKENTNTMRQAIWDNGGHVDAWILTHYHQDHIDAFNEIYSNLDGITVDEIYVTPLDADKFYSVAQEWDDVDSFDKFHEITADADNINYVSRNDALSFSDDLTIRFFNSYDDVVVECTEDIPNNDSLVFKLETANRSMLICSDCHSQFMGEYFVSTYGDELDADILQCAHHGNNSIPTDTGFYELVSPEIAIFDAPEWLMTSPEYTAGLLAAYLQELGTRIVYYNTAPNVFGLY